MMSNWMDVVDIATVSGSRQTRSSVNQQLKQYLPMGATLASYSFEEGLPDLIRAKVLLLTGESFEKRVKDMEVVWEESQIVIAKRAVNMESVNMLVALGSNNQVLVVNDSEASALDAIDDLKNIGFTTWNYIPYSPDMLVEDLPKDDITCTISVGEPDAVPAGFEPVYDIGTRIISVETIAEVWGILGWPMEAVSDYLEKYVKQIVSMAQRLYASTGRVDEANRNMESLIDSIDDGLLVYDRNSERIAVFNTQLQKLSGITDGVVGKKLSQVVKEHTILEFLTSGEGGEILVEWNGRKMMVSRFSADEGREICTFRSIENIRTESNKLARELVQQGFYSKYTFDDIWGYSEEILTAKDRALRLAQTDLNILIEGESGTGKELFAAAMHRASSRRDKPYLAINFSSLNDSLMESELFGYEEGAFTGARRGGKAGVFEMANGGTIFLDEIGDISLKMQVGLLRVLQEKEVMRIGDGKIRYVDVRIIAATNQNLMEKVEQGLFREDLYYRLKIGHLYVPPLRSHKEDIPYLAQMLLLQDSQEEVSMSPELLDWMENQSWPGNVRELKNTIIYMNALRTGSVIGMEDLPDQRYMEKKRLRRQPESMEAVRKRDVQQVTDCKDDVLLELIEALLAEGILLGRRQLLEESRKRGICQTEYQLRKRLTALEQNGKIIMGKGKVGIQLP